METNNKFPFVLLIIFPLCFIWLCNIVSAQDDIYYPPQVVNKQAKVKGDDKHVYPIDAGLLKIEGITDIQVYVDDEGTVTRIKFYRDTHPTLMESAEDIISHMEFEAAEIDSVPVNSWTWIRFSYWMEKSLIKPRYEEIKALLDSVQADYDRKNYTKAFRICEQSYHKIDDMASYYKNYAHQLEVKDRKSEAHVALWTSMMFEEEKYLTLYYMGRVHKEIKQYDHAIAAFEATIRLAPNHPDPYHELSRIYFSQRDDEKFLYYAHKNREIDPYDLRPQFNIALLYILLNDTDKAESLYSDAIQDAIKYHLPLPKESLEDLKLLLEDPEHEKDARTILFDIFQLTEKELESI